MEKTQKAPKPLTAIDQLALAAIVDHLEPHDCQWNLYGEAAQSVVDAVKLPIEVQAIRSWAADLESYLDDQGETYFKLRPQDLYRRADELEAEDPAPRSALAEDPWATESAGK